MFRCYDGKVLARGMQNFGGVAGYFAGSSMLKSMAQTSAPAVTAAAPAVTGATAPISANSNQAVNIGRADLLQTSASGVLGTDPTGRRKVLGAI